MASSFDSTLSTLGVTRTAQTAATSASAAKSTLDQSDFLKLMTAQMKNQDPFSPVDNTQMVAQMAQFSSLAGISEMSTTLKAIQDKLSGTTGADAASYIGRSVLTAGNTAYARTTGGLAGAIELPGAATDVTVSISGPDGSLLKTMSLGPQEQGSVGYDWDGKLSDGTTAGAGPFTVQVIAKNGNATIPSTGLVWAPVQSVSTTGGTLKLSLPGIGDIGADDIRQIG